MNSVQKQMKKSGFVSYTPERLRKPLTSLQRIIRKYLSGRKSRAELYQSFVTFLQQLFPAIIFPEWKLFSLNSQTVKCLERTVFSHDLRRRPFHGELLRPLLIKFPSALVAGRTLLRSLKIIHSVLTQVANQFWPSKNCSAALAQFHLCPACMGVPSFTLHRVCQPFCQATLTGCLRSLRPLGESLNLLQQRLRELLQFGMSSSGLQRMCLRLPHLISMAVRVARLKYAFYRSQVILHFQVNSYNHINNYNVFCTLFCVLLYSCL